MVNVRWRTETRQFLRLMVYDRKGSSTIKMEDLVRKTQRNGFESQRQFSIFPKYLFGAEEQHASGEKHASGEQPFLDNPSA
jgi:hypothetical protein